MDECSSSQSQANVCLDLGDDIYTCQCDGPGWSQGPRDKSCTPPMPLCLSNECQTVGHPGNKCTDNRDATYTCLCTVPFYATENDQDCVQRLPPSCRSDECSSKVNPKNLCQTNDTVGGELENTGDYKCVCDTPFWRAVEDASACEEVTDSFSPNNSINLNDPMHVTLQIQVAFTSIARIH
jgi:hypothetical protein